ncbi:MAG: 16S rRNA (cytidine(1402)-2'-O)-methyltransferase [Hyphomicrobium sp. 32-62-53]|nr:MAG: 16S rRNA (cytidine(1402)-2'-O)-methyltransferase [Hyphomicrobium sp. 12-62-95]OYY01858.1 MAG: 16S rRNA (cytidine(1402)-2'-O)-methyltransferase [Hyphomicrobium sp. 32-62-53]
MMQSDDAPDDDPKAAASPTSEAVAQRVSVDLVRRLTEPLAPGLYLVATPIGNLADITLRALATLARADVIYCEDTRHSRTLVAHYGITRTLRPYHEHNAEEQRPRILADLARGARIALISDAGTPLVSDPGYKLVRDCIAEGHTVVAIPGASAVMTGICVAGLPTDTFLFAGFLPPRSGARQTRIAELASVPATLIFFEAPTRLAETLADLATTLGHRPAAVARELTKLHEHIARGPLSDLAAHFENAPPKGEIVILVGPPGNEAVTDEAIIAALENALAHMSLRDAAKAVAERLSAPKARVYDLGLKLKADRTG